MVRSRKLSHPRAELSTNRAVPFAVAALFVAPALALFGVFLLYPLFTVVSYSFFEWTGTMRGEFVGFGNFARLFTDLPFRDEMPNAFLHNALFFVGTMVIQNTLGLFLALQLFRRERVRRLLQTLYTLPYLVSPLVVGYLWSLMLSPNFGIVNAVLRGIGLDSLAVSWLGDPTYALPVVILISGWQWVGFPVLLYGAGLASQPRELIQAAATDGASRWQTFVHVQLPQLVPVLGTVTILTFIYTMEIFPLVYALGGSTGSPAGATDVLALLFYRSSFQSGAANAIGTSASIGTLMFLMIFGTAVLANYGLRRHEERLS